MKIYLAGNFPQMATAEKEYKVLNKALPRFDYRRLVSFYYATAAGGSWELTDNVILAFKRCVEQGVGK